ncbi:TPA: DUF4440 domain-containing protein [Pseudomonas aeruginosa]|uniref:nuclear transport factor 2 family protein n=1 Tax=Pseudomonas aeruginosa TaxID=287 RepID=UPI0009A20260|nr:DUF4440 domain-containing protein [Pseudomonas aeruginosa]ELK4809470.1 DUF4440 domain-containing protein [Pseudomonas aeruginosa]MCO4040767.1 DUF4440 domain-containing protein [Pseudomonas aeruginosa]MUJ02812.1 DUF4440 domain-containing protein [Pseudomonas aeruginosa]HBN8272107.1 DUF4440 domain-containing protein [Pseudomonas aeruginosa]HBO2773412.1 DUF4440 domain-containing protein [Pseudomonas aeruginosa]
MDIRLEILALEQLLLDPEARKNDRLLKQLLAEDFVEFGAVGKSWTKVEVIVGLKSQTWIKRTIEDFKLRVLADGVALATYRCRHQNANGDESLSMRSSVWKTYEDGWHMVFHQGTRVSE